MGFFDWLPWRNQAPPPVAAAPIPLPGTPPPSGGGGLQPATPLPGQQPYSWNAAQQGSSGDWVTRPMENFYNFTPQKPLAARPAEQQALEFLGFQLPEVEQPDPYDWTQWAVPGSEVALDPYTYSLSADEVNLIGSAYKDFNGYQAPESWMPQEYTPEVEIRPMGARETSPLAAAAGGHVRVTENQQKQPFDVEIDPGEVFEMTEEAYWSLTPDQRAQVDFNTMLFDARQADLTQPVTLDGEAQIAYDDMLQTVFGSTERGSDIVGMNTLKLLDSMGLEAHGQDLDDFLSMERGFTADEIVNFEMSDEELMLLDKALSTAPRDLEKNGDQYMEIYGAKNMGALDATVLARSSEFLNEALSDPTAWDFGSAVDNALGNAGKTQPGDVPFGFAQRDENGVFLGRVTDEDQQKEAWFQETWQQLVNGDITSSEQLLDKFTRTQLTAEDIDEVYESFSLQLGKMERGGQDVSRLQSILYTG